MDAELQNKLDRLKELLKGGSGQALWDVLTCLRGPDSPSERPDMSPSQQSTAYRGRRERKRRTVEVIRGLSVGQQGGARTRDDITYVTLPPREEWDHFDKHVDRAARAMGLEVRIEKNSPVQDAPVVEGKVPVTFEAPKCASKEDKFAGLKGLVVDELAQQLAAMKGAAVSYDIETGKNTSTPYDWGKCPPGTLCSVCYPEEYMAAINAGAVPEPEEINEDGDDEDDDIPF